MNELFNKIKNQSTLIIILFLGYAFFALKDAGSFYSPAAISGVISLGLAIFLGIGNFFIIQMSEHYGYIIESLKKVITTLNSQQRISDRRVKNLMTETVDVVNGREITGGYTSTSGSETQT